MLRRILIRGPDTIGSFVLATPFFRELRKNFDKNYIVLCVKPLVYDLAKECPYVDKVLVYSKNRIENIKKFRQENFDTTFLLSGSFESALVCYLSGIKNRIGYPHDHRGILLTHKIVEPQKKHYVDYLLYILEYLGCEIKEKKLELYIKPEDLQFEKYDYLFDTKKPVVGITYSSVVNDARRWPLEYVLKLAELLVNKGYQVVLLGKTIGHREIKRDFIIDLVNKTSLYEFIYILKKLEIYISVSTGGIHLAAALGKKVIGIYIPGEEIGWYPYTDNAKIITRYVKCAPCDQHKMKYCKDNICLKFINPYDVLELIP